MKKLRKKKGEEKVRFEKYRLLKKWQLDRSTSFLDQDIMNINIKRV